MKFEVALRALRVATKKRVREVENSEGDAESVQVRVTTCSNLQKSFAKLLEELNEV